MNTSSTQSTAVALLQAGLSMPLETIVLSRSQRKALDYAKSLHEKGQLSDLSLSGNKTDNALFCALNLRNEVSNALNNNQKIYSLIQKRNGSDTRFAMPKSAKIADLFTWVAALEAQIRGKDDSTEKAVESRRDTIQTRFGDCINLVEALRVVQVSAPVAAPVAAPAPAAAAVAAPAPAAAAVAAPAAVAP